MAWAVKRGNRWQGRYYDDNGRTRSAGTWDRKNDAIQAAKIKANETTEQPNPTMLWGDWEPVWWAKRQVLPGTLKADRPSVEKHVIPKWADTPLRDIKRADVADWIKELQDADVAPGTIKKLVGHLSSSITAAMQRDLVDVNPCRGVKLPKSPPSPDRYLTQSERARLRAAMPDDWGFFFDLLLHTGMRTGEGFGLHWEDVDLEHATIRVAWSMDRNMRTFKPPKSHAQRSLPIGPTLLEILRVRASEGAGMTPPLPYTTGRKMHTDLVVESLNDTAWRYAWRAAVKVAGVGNVRPHDLRHTYITDLVRAGVPMSVVQKIAGHESITTTERYSHVAPDYFEQARSALQ